MRPWAKPCIPYLVLCLALAGAEPLSAQCTSILVSRGASADGSVMLTYSADLGGMVSRLRVFPAGDHEKEDPVEIFSWVRGERVRLPIPQVSHTYAVVGLMNEHQLALGETTTGGRPELVNRTKGLDYEALMMLALQRCRSAREAIRCIADLAAAHGYRGPGETLSIADKEEAWIMEIVGKGPDEKGALWVAARVPEGSLTCHANLSRITTFPLDDPGHWLYAQDVIDFAVKKGYFDPGLGRPFSFREAYHPLDPVSVRVCAGRVWSVYRRSAPSRNFSDAFFRGMPGAKDYPLFIEPDRKLTLRDVMGLMRDHYEGTPYDMTRGLDAGPFGSPYRFRPLVWKAGGQRCCWERPISSQQAAFVMVAQARRAFPDPVGGVLWYAPDDAYTACFLPFYCGVSEVPPAFREASPDRFSFRSAWWIFNRVANLAYDRWDRVFPAVRAARDRVEDGVFAVLPAVERTAAEQAEKDPAQARRLLTAFSTLMAEGAVARWRALWEEIVVRHNDGFLREPGKGTRSRGYAERWLERVIREEPGRFTVPEGGKDDG